MASLPYLIVHAVAADTVTILAVFHTSRDLARALAERASDGTRRRRPLPR